MKHRIKLPLAFIVLNLGLLMSGCTSTTKHKKDVIPELPIKWKNEELNLEGQGIDNGKVRNKLGQSTTGKNSSYINQKNESWWGVFKDPRLDDMMIKAFTANVDLKQTAIRIKQTQLRNNVSAQNKFPSLTTSASGSFSTGTSQDYTGYVPYVIVPSVTGTTATGSSPTANGIVDLSPSSLGISKYYSVSQSFQYEVDVWSRLADQRSSDRMELEAQKKDEEIAKMSLAAQVAANYWTIALIDYKLPLLEVDISDAKRSKDIAQLKVKINMQIPSTMKDAKISVEQRKSQLDRMKRDRLTAVYSLAMLLNVLPQQFEIARASIPNKAIHLPGLRAGTPASILNKRPDLRSAWLRLNQSLIQVKSAEKARYPSISLSGSLSSNVQSLKNIVSNPLGSLALNLSLPAIDWARLNVDVKTSKMQYESAVLGFRTTLYRALVEVETAMENLQSSRIALKNAQLSYDSAVTKESLAHLRYQVGIKDKESWLSEQANKRNSYTNLVQSRITLFQNWIQLGKALGGYEYLEE